MAINHSTLSKLKLDSEIPLDATTKGFYLNLLYANIDNKFCVCNQLNKIKNRL
jgi:hypothetical protein